VEVAAEGSEIVATRQEAKAQPLAPLIVLEPLREFLDRHGLGEGPLSVTRVGYGQYNATFLLRRGGDRWILRRPPRPPFPPSTHDVIREFQAIEGAGGAGARVPEAICAEPNAAILGAPFYLMSFVDGEVITDSLPSALAPPSQRAVIGVELVAALSEIHAIDWRRSPLQALHRQGDYLGRQLRRFAGLWKHYERRSIAAVDEAERALEELRPSQSEETLVHGDFRLGNTIFSTERPSRLRAVIDWEMASIGDPLADLGYLTSTWSEPEDSEGVLLELGAVTSLEGFDSRAELVDAYERYSGRDTSKLPWYEALACWKSAVLLEGMYGRAVDGLGERTRFSRKLEWGVPDLAQRAVAALERVPSA